MSARGQIVGWMVLLVVIALSGSVVATAQITSVRADDLVDERIELAARNFRAFSDSPSARDAGTVDQVLTQYLRDTVPNRAEAAFSVVNGKASRRTAGSPPARLDTDRAFVDQVAKARRPTSGTTDTDAGTVRWAVIPVSVRGEASRASLVILVFESVLTAPLYESIRIFGFVAATAVVLAGIASWLVAGRVLAPVRLVRQTAERIGDTDLRLRIPVHGRDDVARLAGAFNTMLDRLESSFTAQRRLVDDAGHELRTPITVIRGHLELMPDAPAEREQAMTLAIDELGRMNRIVDELLVLAQAGQPDFVVPGDVNLTDLTVDLLANARMLADRRWELDAVAEGIAIVDGQRLTQALMQLVSNAVQHTDPGNLISVGSTVENAQLQLWVRDSGSGIAPEDNQRIFERFQRGTGARRGDGAGLGLSIVTSIAEAHGGVVEVESQPGRGTTFRLDIPVTMLADENPREDPREDPIA